MDGYDGLWCILIHTATISYYRRVARIFRVCVCVGGGGGAFGR